MPVTKPGAAARPTVIPQVPIYPIHPATGDVQQHLTWDEEAFLLHCNRYWYWVLDVHASKPDHLYGEPTEEESGGEVFAVPILIHAYVYWDSAAKSLQKVGIVTERETVFEFSNTMLTRAGIDPKRGDVIVVNKEEFVIEEVKPGQPYYGNIQYPIHTYCPSNRRKHSNIGDDRADPEANVGPQHPAPSAGIVFPAKPDSLYGE